MLVSIEGNIGSGKSTIINFLKNLNSNDIVFVDEPVDEWVKIKDNSGQNALQLFYDNQKENSFWFQILAYITRLRNLIDVIKNNENKIIICERSIYTDKNVFASMLYQSGMFKEIEWKTYLYWFDTFKEQTQLDLILYVNTEPEECLARINKRNRIEEKNKISLDYLKECHDKHIQWISTTNTKIINIDGHQSIENIYKFVENITTNLQSS